MSDIVDSTDCPLCGDTNARAILMLRNFTYVCPDPFCPNFCSDRKRLIDGAAKLLESSDELDFLTEDDVYLSLTD